MQRLQDKVHSYILSVTKLPLVVSAFYQWLFEVSYRDVRRASLAIVFFYRLLSTDVCSLGHNFQRRIQNLVKHPRQSFFQKQLRVECRQLFLGKPPFSMFTLVLNTPAAFRCSICQTTSLKFCNSLPKIYKKL